ncbi:MAG: DUF1819 family protein [Saprospiraceae bacterium]|nr:DUF1819 family protein [Saprospiraceae bacterium]
MSNLLSFKNEQLRVMIEGIILKAGVTQETLLILYWNASANNELLFHLNEKVFFPAFYSGRVSIKNDEVIACIKDLKQSENDLKKWSVSTISVTSSKYLTLLKKFGLMEGSLHKNIVHPHLNDGMFVLFTYWFAAISDKPNLVDSNWIQYCFSEKQNFLDRLLQKKFSKYFNVVYTGDRLSIEPIIPYESIYEYISKS